MASAASSPSKAEELAAALRAARARETAHFEARARLNDAKRLRLEVLKDELAGLVPSSGTVADVVNLTLSPSEPPCLWVDLVTSVVMEPEPNIYRLIEDTESGRVTLLETSDRSALVEQVKHLMAHRMIARERHKVVPFSAPAAVERYSAAALIVAWLTGFGIATLFFVAIAIYLKTNGY